MDKLVVLNLVISKMIHLQFSVQTHFPEQSVAAIGFKILSPFLTLSDLSG